MMFYQVKLEQRDRFNRAIWTETDGLCFAFSSLTRRHRKTRAASAVMLHYSVVAAAVTGYSALVQ